MGSATLCSHTIRRALVSSISGHEYLIVEHAKLKACEEYE